MSRLQNCWKTSSRLTALSVQWWLTTDDAVLHHWASHSCLHTIQPLKFSEQLLLSIAQIPFELFEASVPLKQTVSARTQAYFSLQQRPYWAPSHRGGNLISLLQGCISAAPHMCAHVVYHQEGASAGWKSQFGTGEAPCRKPFILLRNETDGSWNGPRWAMDASKLPGIRQQNVGWKQLSALK